MMEISGTDGWRRWQGQLWRWLAALLSAIPLIATPAGAADLQPQTLEAFQRYASLAQVQFDWEVHRRAPFLWWEGLPESRRAAVAAELRSGKVVIERLEISDGGTKLEIPEGLIHHWIGTVFIPGATLAQTLGFEQDYDHHQDYFRPDVVRSKILRRNGNDFIVELRFYKKKMVTTVFETEHEVHYELIDPKHAWCRSRGTRIQEVENAGKSDERLNPPGHDRGFLWAMDTYWRFEEADGGTYVESQSISLTRDIPTGLGWLIGPYVNSVPRESLTFTLATTRTEILRRISVTPTK